VGELATRWDGMKHDFQRPGGGFAYCDLATGHMKTWTPTPIEKLLEIEQELLDVRMAELHEVAPLLLGELALAEAPFTGRRTACVLKTMSGSFGGHAIERPDGSFVHATSMALRQVPSHQRVDSVYLVGDGPGVAKPKHVMPTPGGYDELAPRLHFDAELVVVNTATLEERARVEPEDHQSAYAHQAHSYLGGDSWDEVKERLARHTKLSETDQEFLATLSMSGREEGVHFFLTGSASNRGAASTALGAPYNDLDIIAITHRNRAETESLFEAMADAHYGALQKEPHDVVSWPSGVVREGVTYRNDAVAIDFFTAPTLEAAMVRPEYLERNFYHQVS
jgi:hypothetical protein